MLFGGQWRVFLLREEPSVCPEENEEIEQERLPEEMQRLRPEIGFE
jgi:hypothetical protein